MMFTDAPRYGRHSIYNVQAQPEYWFLGDIGWENLGAVQRWVIQTAQLRADCLTKHRKDQ